MIQNTDCTVDSTSIRSALMCGLVFVSGIGCGYQPDVSQPSRDTKVEGVVRDASAYVDIVGVSSKNPDDQTARSPDLNSSGSSPSRRSSESKGEGVSHQARALAEILFQGNCAKFLGKASVREQLGLSEDQCRRLAGLEDSVKNAVNDLRKRPVAELPMMLREYEQAGQEIEKTIDQTLTTEQVKELRREVLSGVQGPLVLLAPHVIQKLNLNDSQIDSIAAIVWQDFEQLKKASLWELPTLKSRSRESRRQAEMSLSPAQLEILHELVRKSGSK
ncbi:hypothetical protein Spb1_38330 [Planctopirus ephydatiae]|uniref:LTXXQ motif protein n=1 Tax=Planctopirus ephydatiae TaxID=2528019 RepID=A0A518GTG9_9PLAN|nr:hypothetical protein [Planctopirus ephydatiae]QDV31887.1 hypothetical protein Spb1_38330 [Planctopirus ephydatiae]